MQKGRLAGGSDQRMGPVVLTTQRTHPAATHSDNVPGERSAYP